MSVRNAIANCKKPIGSGADRVAYYSPKYNLVFKRQHAYRIGKYGHINQCEREIAFFKKMSLSDKEVFPMVGFEYMNGQPVIIMKKCTPIEDINPNVFNVSDDQGMDEMILEIGRIVNANQYSIHHVIFFINDYNLIDIHIGNLAVDEDNNLVIIDCGI